VKDRERRISLAEDVEIVVERSSQHPVVYAIMLIARRDDQWHTVHMFDNAHGVTDHHEHRYIGANKQDPAITHHGSINDAMGAALVKLQEQWADIVGEWDRTR
jgi:hypothetical protein